MRLRHLSSHTSSLSSVRRTILVGGWSPEKTRIASRPFTAELRQLNKTHFLHGKQNVYRNLLFFHHGRLPIDFERNRHGNCYAPFLISIFITIDYCNRVL